LPEKLKPVPSFSGIEKYFKPYGSKGMRKNAQIIGTTVAGILLMTSFCKGDLPDKRPNFLIIQCDQLGQRVIGSYGSEDHLTPAIDRIADQGICFTNAYTGCPLCQPSRASILTGLMPHQVNVRSNDGLLKEPEVPDSIETIGTLFSKAGYEAVHFGKKHDKGALRGFLHVQSDAIKMKDDHFPLNSDSFKDAGTCRDAIQFLSTPPDKPFICMVDFNNPHNICGYIGENEGEHKDEEISCELPLLPDNFETDDLQTRPLPIQYICCSHRRLRQASHWSKENYRHYLAAYHYYTKLVDRDIQKVLDALYSTPAGKNTVIVLLADHGDGMASHRMVTKQVSFYEETTRVPLIFAGKGIVSKSGSNDMLVSTTTDMMSTLCELAGIRIPADRKGISLAPILKGQKQHRQHNYVASEWYSEWGYTISPGRMIRTSRYKYTRYLEGNGEELYDLKIDPGEKVNLAINPEYHRILEQHRTILDQYIIRTKDNFFSLSVVADPKWRSHPPGYMNHEGPSAPEEKEWK
jgi:choline-sulfatase